jgi:hypothetical protein
LSWKNLQAQYEMLLYESMFWRNLQDPSETLLQVHAGSIWDYHRYQCSKGTCRHHLRHYCRYMQALSETITGTNVLREPADSIWDSTAGTDFLQEPTGSICRFAVYTEDTSHSCTTNVCVYHVTEHCNSNIPNSQKNKSHILQIL